MHLKEAIILVLLHTYIAFLRHYLHLLEQTLQMCKPIDLNEREKREAAPSFSVSAFAA
ncbi:hypothetical protein Bca101_019796 [Brassica carinata]